MNVSISISGLIFIAAITPGPNNLVVLRLAGARGLKSALPAIAGVVAGGLALIALTQIGLDTIASRYPWLNRLLLVAGAVYLGGLGARLVYCSFRGPAMAFEPKSVAPLGAPALFVLQFANPKAWILVLTVCAAARGAAASAFVLPVLFALISSASLLAWAILGHAASRILQKGLARAGFDAAMGVLLIASASSLTLSGF